MGDSSPRLTREGRCFRRAKESFSKGMVGLLEPIVQEMDARSSKIMDSQKILMEKVESFSAGG